jgi:hypothetical protein
MPSTPTLALPYPNETDTADVPKDFKSLATQIETKLGANSGFASLDSSGKLLSSQLPAGGTTAAVVATTVAGLGTASSGKIGLIRAGSSPYEMIGLTYDSTKAKWVSPELVFSSPGASGTVNANTDSLVLWAIIDGWDSIKAAGLTMEARLSFFMNANVTTNNGYDLGVLSQAITAGYPTAIGSFTNLASVRTLPTASNRGYDLGWIAANPASNNRAIFAMNVNSSSSGNSCQYYFPCLRVRFVG